MFGRKNRYSEEMMLFNILVKDAAGQQYPNTTDHHIGNRGLGQDS
jgi:hypothetical protein